MITGIGIIALKCKDWEGMIIFYRDTLGLPVRLVDEAHKYAMFFTGDVRFAIEDIGIAPANPPEPDQSVVVVNFRVEGLEGTVAELSAKGVAFSSDIRQGPGYRYAKFADPEGNQHVLFERQAS
ncbi:MAG: hypothetical protein C1O27_001449 [Chloroflexi bacterium]|jgi:predicted enzyme related to lactoylglutathione lyase|nr:MAG: hypothetical protein C1O27_001449 [Chloroflexota bacterium]